MEVFECSPSQIGSGRLRTIVVDRRKHHTKFFAELQVFFLRLSYDSPFNDIHRFADITFVIR